MDASTSQLVSQMMKKLADHIRRTCIRPPEFQEGPVSPLDDEIKALELAFNAVKTHTNATLSLLRSRRNQGAIIRRLPNELLTLIFLFAGSGTGRLSDNGDGGDGGTELSAKRVPNVALSISGVCRFWRILALDTSLLWRNISVTSAPLIELFIERSKGAALDITVELETTRASTGTSGEHITCLSAHAERWRSLTLLPLIDKGHINIKRILPWITRRLPNLKVLSITQTESEWGSDLSRSLAGIFDDERPELDELILTGIHIPFAIPVYQGLTKLHLSRMTYEIPTAVVHILHALHESPLLEELRLDAIEITFEIDDTKIPHSLVGDVELAHLRSLFFRSVDVAALQFFLTYLHIPASTQLHIESEEDLAHDQDLCAIFPPDPTNLLNLCRVYHLQFISMDGGEWCIIRGYDKANVNVLLTIIIHGDTGCGPVQKIFSSLGPALGIIPARTLSVEQFTNRKWSATKFRDTLAFFPNIHKIAFLKCHAKFLRALRPSPLDDIPLLPRLKNLIISDCAISDSIFRSVVLSRALPVHDANADPRFRTSALMSVAITGSPDVSRATLMELWEYLDVNWHLDGTLLMMRKYV